MYGSTFLSALLPAVWLLFTGYDKRWAGDDGFINLRVVHQLMAGNGFVYNAGERTEVVTSAGWVLVLWLVGELGLDLQTAAWVLSLGLSALGLFMAALATARVREDEATPSTLVLPLGVLAYAAIPVSWEYATSALENGLGLGFLGTSYYLVARAATGKRDRGHACSAVFCGLAPLVRPDFSIFGAALILVLLLLARDWKTRVRVALCAAVPGVAFEIFRMGYFACLVPNTALAKEAFATHWAQGYQYLQDMLSSYALQLPVLAAVLSLAASSVGLLRAPPHIRLRVPVVMAGAGALHVLYIVRVGGDFMHGRLLLPGLFGIFAGAAVVQLPLSHIKRGELQGTRLRAIAVGALLAGALLLNVGWSVYCARHLHSLPSAYGINDERRYYVETSGTAHPTRAEDYRDHIYYAGPFSIRRRIAERCPFGAPAMQDESRVECPRFALPDGTEGVLTDQPPDVLLPLEPSSTAPFVLGVMGFRPLGIAGLAVGLRMNVVDGFSLADPLASRMEVLARGRPGHEKFFNTWWFAAKYVADGATHDERVLTARRVLRCGLVAELHAATRDPMTFSRFVRNMRLAFVLHGLRIPTDPHEAERKFCS